MRAGLPRRGSGPAIGLKCSGIFCVPCRRALTRAASQELKKAENPFRVAIVCAMWLTGFDVKSLATLGMDKGERFLEACDLLAASNWSGCVAQASRSRHPTSVPRRTSESNFLPA